MEDEDPQWWPIHVRIVFATLGGAMGDARLYPHTLVAIPREFGSILPGHQVEIKHVSGKTEGRRKGYYLLEIHGPVYEGRWRFASGKLDRLCRAAAPANSQGDR